MGTFLFKWTHPATEVFVTGTFDDWGKTVKLDKTADGNFEKLVDLPITNEKIVYKFVVDDNWTTDHLAPTQIDEHGNSNNILLPEDITTKTATDLPGAFPETPAPGAENQTFSVNPIPATAGIGNPVQLRPGEKVPDPSTLTSNTIDSTVTLDKDSFDKGPSGAPVLPNPITPDAEREKQGAGLFGLPPVTDKMIPESSLPMGAGATATGLERDPGVTIQGGGGAPTTAALAGAVPLEPRGTAQVVDPAPDVTIQSGGGAPTTAALAGEVPLEPRGTATTVDQAPDVAIQSGGDAPTTAALAGAVPLEPRGTATTVDQAPDVAIQSGGGAPTTAALAGDVPVEPRGVPEVVQDSQGQAPSDARGASAEASANPEAVIEHKSVNEEIEKTVPTAAATSGEQSVSGKVAEIAGGAAAGATAAVAAAAALATKAKDNVTSDETKEAAKEQAASAQETAANVATQSKETATNAASSLQASALAAAAAVKAQLPVSVQQKLEQVLPVSATGTGSEPAAPQVPEIVKESISEAHQPAEAAVNPTQVSHKAEVEQELAEVVKPAESSGDPAPTVTAATSETAPTTINKSTETPLDAGAAGAAAGAAVGGGAAAAALGKSTENSLNAPASAPAMTADSKPPVSRDVSPMTRTDGQSGPVATSGVKTTDIPAGAPAATEPVTSGPAASSAAHSGPAASTAGISNPAVSAAQKAASSPPMVAPGSPSSTRSDEPGTPRSAKRRSFFGRIKDKIHHKRSESKSDGKSDGKSES